MDFASKILGVKTREKRLGGYAIGGLAGGESKDSFWRVVEKCTSPVDGLPKHMPRYLMVWGTLPSPSNLSVSFSLYYVVV